MTWEIENSILDPIAWQRMGATSFADVNEEQKTVEQSNVWEEWNQENIIRLCRSINRKFWRLPVEDEREQRIFEQVVKETVKEVEKLRYEKRKVAEVRRETSERKETSRSI